jgi:hypothetical protein
MEEKISVLVLRGLRTIKSITGSEHWKAHECVSTRPTPAFHTSMGWT